MATLREAVKTLLEGDSTLMSLLTGGVLDASDLSFDGGGMDELPHEDESSLIKPCAIIRWQDADQFGSNLQIRGRVQAVEIYVYENSGYNTIDSALNRLSALLDQVRVNADDRQLAYFVYSHESREMNAPELAGIPFRFMRFMNTFVR